MKRPRKHRAHEGFSILNILIIAKIMKNSKISKEAI